jgi:hypothetical protein
MGWARAAASRQPVLFINPKSGGGRAGRAGLVEAARERGIEPIVLWPGDDLLALAAEAAAGGAVVLTRGVQIAQRRLARDLCHVNTACVLAVLRLAARVG